jgi:hypothetical protein
MTPVVARKKPKQASKPQNSATPTSDQGSSAAWLFARLQDLKDDVPLLIWLFDIVGWLSLNSFTAFIVPSRIMFLYMAGASLCGAGFGAFFTSVVFKGVALG